VKREAKGKGEGKEQKVAAGSVLKPRSGSDIVKKET
jgi:hypothetical protein